MDVAVLNLKLLSVINKISVYTSQKTPCTYITKSSLLMSFGKQESYLFCVSYAPHKDHMSDS
jgi:hypothetical protein